MANRDLQELSKFEDKISYLYFEMGHICEHSKSIAYFYKDKFIPIPVETIALLMLGPGTTITHEAIKRIAESRCLLTWTGDESVRFYSAGYSGTYSSHNMLRQAECFFDSKKRKEVIFRMYQKRFEEALDPNFELQQVRGREGNRVRSIYKKLSEEYGVEWTGRNYDQKKWENADPINKAISAGNATLYGIVQSAILSSGFSPSIGFIHIGKILSFVYDIADLYKTDIVLPLAFNLASDKNIEKIEKEIRLNLRDVFKKEKFMKKIIPDIKEVLFGSIDSREDYSSDEGLDVAVCIGV